MIFGLHGSGASTSQEPAVGLDAGLGRLSFRSHSEICIRCLFELGELFGDLEVERRELCFPNCRWLAREALHHCRDETSAAG